VTVSETDAETAALDPAQGTTVDRVAADPTDIPDLIS